MCDRSDGLTIRFRPNGGCGIPERVRLEPRRDGLYDYFEDAWNGCRWVPRGHDTVTDLTIEGSLSDIPMPEVPDDGAPAETDALSQQLQAALEATDSDDVDTRYHIRQALQLCDRVNVEAER